MIFGRPLLKDYAPSGSWSPVSVAVDWIGNNIYVVDSLGQKIDVFDFEGVYYSIVVSSNLTRDAFISQRSAHFRFTLKDRLTSSMTIIYDILLCHFAVT